MIDCFWKKNFGFDCLGCGFQRSVALLMDGKVWESIQMYPSTMPYIFTILYTLLHLRFSFKNGARNIIILFVFCVVLMIINYAVKHF